MKIALIGCTKKKKNYPCPASELYSESTLFRYAYEYAKENADKVYVLSALHGLVKMEDVIAPYDYTLNGKLKEEKLDWTHRVIKEMENEFDLEKDELIFLAGDNYRKYLIPFLKALYGTKIDVPLKGLGLGKQCHYLKNNISNSSKIENNQENQKSL